MTPSCGAHNAVMQHSNPKTAAEGGKSGFSAAQPGGTGRRRPYRGWDQRLIMK